MSLGGCIEEGDVRNRDRAEFIARTLLAIAGDDT